MAYGTSHLLTVGEGGYFQGEDQEKKILLCKGGGHYMKNKTVSGMCFVNST